MFYVPAIRVESWLSFRQPDLNWQHFSGFTPSPAHLLFDICMGLTLMDQRLSGTLPAYRFISSYLMLYKLLQDISTK
jgi:hypothetical protein